MSLDPSCAGPAFPRIYTGSCVCVSEVENLPGSSEALRSVPSTGGKTFFPNHVIGVIYARKNHRQGLP